MTHSLLSLVEEAPPGFEFRPQLSRRDVRRDVFALFAPSPEAAEEALGPPARAGTRAGRVRGRVPRLVGAALWPPPP